ncbi:MAG: poly-gamma-glutamate hydrolase family protein [Gammaproteobacteria bacterium]|nr:poly-gamma-glutamate hydrolase family protein [Gammaproteobacteria bacterium]
MDTYSNFAELYANESDKNSFRISVCKRDASLAAIIAPHGGGIEPGTSEIVLAIAADDLSYALFEGTKIKENRTLHITSTNFDEPQCCNLIQKHNYIIAIHGESSNKKIIYLGGRDNNLGGYIKSSLEANGFIVTKHHNPNLQGKSNSNICNSGLSGMGVQLELSNGLRKTFFKSLTAEGRSKPAETVYDFSRAIREGLYAANIIN